MSDSTSKLANTNPYPLWAPRFWHGMLLSDWIRLLIKHRFRVHPFRWGLAAGVTITSSFNSKMALAQIALLGHKIGKTPVPDDPVFILGHWRSGTTYLHELLSVDTRFATPTTYQCFAPNHFLLTEPFITRLFWFLIPSRRPMDNVVAGWHEPQEDEFALCAMGLPSPYLRMAFPNDVGEHLEYLDMDELDGQAVAAWKKGFDEFLRRLSHHHGKRIVLKSPTHTGRIALLAKMFPKAKFIHIVRNPYDVVPSTLRLWRSLDDVQGLQIARHDNLEEYIHRAYERMYGGFFQFRSQLSSDRIIELQYESLVHNTCEVVERVYSQLGLGDFESVRERLRATVEAKKDYKRNEHTLNADLTERINQRWATYFDRYGYAFRTPQ